MNLVTVTYLDGEQKTYVNATIAGWRIDAVWIMVASTDDMAAYGYAMSSGHEAMFRLADERPTYRMHGVYTEEVSSIECEPVDLYEGQHLDPQDSLIVHAIRRTAENGPSY